MKYEKAYDSLNWEKLWHSLTEDNKKFVSELKNVFIKYLAGQISKSINTNEGETQGCGLSPNFIHYIHRPNNKIREDCKK
jgi:DNA-directed RNA polymerase